MKSKPILFSAAMVRALLDGTKTQTRRTVKPQPATVEYHLRGQVSDRLQGLPTFREANGKGWATCGPFRCPFIGEGMYASQAGVLKNNLVGDLTERKSLLWVREAHYQFGHWEPVEGKLTKGGRQKWAFIAHPDSAVTFTPPAVYRKGRHHKDSATPAWHKRLARFMPRKYSRITLEVVSVRVERLQEISAEDSIAEGIRVEKGSGLIEGQDCYMMTTNSGYMRGKAGAIAAYQNLWESINGPGSWDLNPWVWVVEFRRVEA